MKRSPMKPVRPHLIPPHIRRAVFDRDDYTCRCCGQWVGLMGHCHHRKLRSQGGEDNVETLILVCGACHLRIHDNKNGLAYRLGFLVHRNDDPALIPVRSLWPVGDDFDGGAA